MLIALITHLRNLLKYCPILVESGAGRGFEPPNQDINKLVLLGLETKMGGV